MQISRNKGCSGFFNVTVYFHVFVQPKFHVCFVNLLVVGLIVVFLYIVQNPDILIAPLAKLWLNFSQEAQAIILN